MVSFVTIGSNFIVDWFLSAAKHCAGFHLHGMYSRDADKARELAQRNGATTSYSSIAAICADPAVDAVYIASPNALHHPQALELLRAGKHVLCEKPVCCNAAELRALQAAAHEHNVVLLEAMRCAHNPAFDAVRAGIGQIGRVHRAILGYDQYSSRYDKFKNGIIENAFNPKLGGSALMDIGVYCVHVMAMLFGAPQKLVAEGMILPDSIDGCGSVLASYEGMSAYLHYSKVNNSILPSEIQGENGCVQFYPLAAPKCVTLVRNSGETEQLYQATGDDPAADMAYEIRRFIEAIEHGTDISAYDALSLLSLEIMDAIRQDIGIKFD